MLDINFENRKGILFVRLGGVLNKNTVSKLQNEITDMIKDNGIRNVVFNLSELKSIDMRGINNLLYDYELCRNNKGKTLVCGINNSVVRNRIDNTRLLKYMMETSDELSALNIINL